MSRIPRFAPRTSSLRFAPLVLPVALFAGGWAALGGGCSATSDTSASGGGATTSSGSAAGGGGAATTGIGGGFQPDGGESDAPLDEDAACATAAAEAQLVPLDMVVLVDQSGSMDDFNTPTKWESVVAATKAFVNDPTNAGVSIGIEYFPVVDPPDADDCNVKWYKTLDVDVAPLPANAAAISASLDAHGPTGATPTYGALQGVLFVATALQDAHPDHKVIVVFATDGDPTECTITDPDQIADLAQKALNYNGVQTFVIGMAGATTSNLDKIAQKGGTTKSYDVSSNPQEFNLKMQEIRKTAVACEFPIPDPGNQEIVDPEKVNVQYTSSVTMMSQTFPKKDGIQSCGNSFGWYYDNPTQPTKILLCPSSCAAVQSDQDAKIKVLFGCKSQIQ